MFSSQYLVLHAEGLLEVSHGPAKTLREPGPLMWSFERIEMALQGMAETQIKKWQHVARRRHRQQDRRRVIAKSTTNRDSASEQAERDVKFTTNWVRLSLLIYALPATIAVVCALVSRRLFFWGMAIWFFSEVVFLVLHMVAYARADGARVRQTLPDMCSLNVLVDRFLLLREHISMEEFMSGWFLGAPFESIYRDNVLDFVAYGFYHSNFSELTVDRRKCVEEHLGKVESVWNVRFPEGYNPSIKYMASERDPLQALHRPLMLYMWADCVAFLTGFVLLVLGFQRYRGANNCLVYWHRPGRTKGVEGESNMPTVFVHGLGIGVTPYLSFVHMLFEDPDHDAVVVEMPHVAMRLRRVIPNVDQLAEDLRQMHERHSLKPACYVGHSYGSMVIARFCQLHPEYVRATALVDPVCFLICFPFTIYNFVYRPPGGEKFEDWLGDWLRWYFVSRELQVSQVLCRGFNWHNIELWPEQLPPTALVMLSGHDAIVPAKHVRKHLESSGVPVVWNAEFRHAEFLFRPDIQRNFLKTLIELREKVEGLHATGAESLPAGRNPEACSSYLNPGSTGIQAASPPAQGKILPSLRSAPSHTYSLRSKRRRVPSF